MPDEISSLYESARVRVWIDVTDLMTRKIESTFVPKPPSREQEVKITVLNTKVKLGESVPESLFVFTPPQGVVEAR